MTPPAFLLDPPEPRTERPVDRWDVPGRHPSRIADLRRMVALRRKVEAELHPPKVMEPVTAHHPRERYGREFADIREAAKLFGTSPRCIRAAIGSGAIVMGRGWSPAGEPWVRLEKRARSNQVIEQIDPETGSVVGCHGNCASAAHRVGCSRSSIAWAVQQPERKTFGFYWRWAQAKERV